MSQANLVPSQLSEAAEEKLRAQTIFRDECAKDREWKKKYIHGSMYLLGAGAYGSVFQVTTRTYSVDSRSVSSAKYMYDPGFVQLMANFLRVKKEQQEKLADKARSDQLLDIVAMKFELLEHKRLEDGGTQNNLFLRREYLVMCELWRRAYRQLVGFPLVFDSGYIGSKAEYGINSKYKDILMIFNLRGEEVNFFEDSHNPDIKDVTTISYLTMELLGPSLDDLKNYFQPWYKNAGMNTFFNVRTTFKIADQFLCRLLVLHNRGFVHHDLKLDNIALGLGRAMNTIYLLDFGFSKKVSDIKDLEWMGSRKFMSIDTYEKQKPNFAQDLESWFYIFMTLLYDGLPWSEDCIVARYGPEITDADKWEAAMSIKKTWWGQLSEAVSLNEMIDTIDSIHRAEVIDINDLVSQIYKKVRDTRQTLKEIDNAATLITDLSNTQSAAFKGYMSIRKVLLSIFKLNGLQNNKLVWDSEFEAIKKAREQIGGQTFDWEESDYEWEWDCYHEKMFPGLSRDRNNADDFVEGNGEASLTNFNAKLSRLLMARRPGKQRPDEVSYVYNSRTNSLVPKGIAGLPAVPFRRSRRAIRLA